MEKVSAALVLVDTSAWIEFFRGSNHPCDVLLQKLIAENRVVLCPTILQEILQGIGDDKEFKKTKAILANFPITNSNPVAAAIGAADLYRNARKKGVTIRRANDCLIAWHAIEHKLAVLHNDNDFIQLAQCSPLHLYS